MDEAARKVLKTKKTDIVKNLIPTDEIFDSLEERNTLTEDMIQRIKAEKTENDMTATLLLILAKRGPNAFKEFVEAIRPHFSFLSEMLEEDYATELENLKAANKDSGQETPSISSENSKEQGVQTYPLLSKNCSQQIASDHEINDTEKSISGKSDFMQRMMQESFRCWYTKLKSHMTSRNLRELSFKSPAPVTYNMVDQLLDELIHTVDGCYRVLGVKDDLVTEIINLKESKKKLKEKLMQMKEQKNKYADNIMKLENKCRDYEEQAQIAKRQYQKLQAEIISLKKETEEKLNEKNNEIKEATDRDAMEQLRKFDNLLLEANDEIENLKEKCIIYERQTGVHNWQLQGAKYETKRSLSRNNSYYERKSVQNHTSTPRKNKHNMHTESTVVTAVTSKQVTGVRHKPSQRSADFEAVEEPDASRQMRPETVVENCYTTSKCPVNRKTERVPSAASDKENNAVSKGHGQQTLNKDKDKSDDPKEKHQTSTVSNSDNVKQTTGVTVARGTYSRRTPIHGKPKGFTTAGRSHASFGTIGTTGQNAKRGVRRASVETPRVLDTLMIVCNNSNNNPPVPNESPRGPKAMKKHH